MKFKTIKNEELFEAGRWNLKVWLQSNQEKLITSFPMVKLEMLLTERKKTLNPQDFEERWFNYLGLENVQSFSGLLVEFAPKLGKEIKSRSKIFFKGDILYGRLRPALNKAILIDERLNEGICSTEFFVLHRKSDEILPNYLRYLLTSDFVLETTKILTSGAALPRIQLKDFMNIEIPLPPLEIQQEYEDFICQAFAEHQRFHNFINSFQGQMNKSLNDFLVSGTIPILDATLQDYPKTWNNPLPLIEKSVLLF